MQAREVLHILFLLLYNGNMFAKKKKFLFWFKFIFRVSLPLSYDLYVSQRPYF